jgi:hypothetical protein
MDAIISFQKVESSRELFNPLSQIKIKRKSLRRVNQLIPGSDKFFSDPDRVPIYINPGLNLHPGLKFAPMPWCDCSGLLFGKNHNHKATSHPERRPGGHYCVPGK